MKNSILILSLLLTLVSCGKKLSVQKKSGDLQFISFQVDTYYFHGHYSNGTVQELTMEQYKQVRDSYPIYQRDGKYLDWTEDKFRAEVRVRPENVTRCYDIATEDWEINLICQIGNTNGYQNYNL